MKKRIEPYRALQVLKNEDMRLKQSIFELETNIQNYQNTDLRLLKEMQEYLLSYRQISQAAQNLSLELMDKNAKLTDCQRNLERCSNTILNLSKQIDVLKSSKEALQKDLKNGKKSGTEESEDSFSLMQSLEKKKNTVIALRMKLNGIQRELDAAKLHLHTNLLQREEQLLELIMTKETEGEHKQSKARPGKRSSVGVKNLMGYDKSMVKEKQKELDKLEQLILSVENTLEELQQSELDSATQRAEVDDQIVSTVVELEKLNVDRRNLHDRMALDKLDELKKKSDEDIIKTKDLKTEKLDELIKAKIHEIKEIEKSGNHSHMYGFFLRMKEQFEEVKKKVDRLGEVKQKIFGILTESEQSKNFAIQNSLKKLAKKFGEYFSYFVKDADTSIKFIKATLETKEEDKEQMKDEKEEIIKEDENEPAIQTNETQVKGLKIGHHQYTGISVRVAFKDKNRMQSLKELSGGEKTVVALSLLLALNSLTGSQIYLLDEVDSALDQVYRAGLTELLAKITTISGTQFFITTFNPELIETVESIYKIEFRSLQSKISPCTKNRALDLLMKIKEEQSKVQNE